MNTLSKITLASTLCSLFFTGCSDIHKSHHPKLPDIKTPKNNLRFKMIEGYEDYKVIATHFRTDKNEIRYILANPIGYNALKKKSTAIPEGSKIVKIVWSVKKMDTFNTALEADKIQRVEYMVKDASKFDANGDHWGYARFVKDKGTYKPWTKGTKGCISCHRTVKENDFLFTRMQGTH